MKGSPGLIGYMLPNSVEVGCDEAGRGCLAGPVVAAAVILPHDFYHPFLNDSKQLTQRNRELLRPYIEENALSWAVCFADAQEIDSINILQASITAMQRALDKLTVEPEHIIVDGNRFRKYRALSGREIPYHCIVKGDSKYASIAAASVLAKTHRDEYMVKLAQEYPAYDWRNNKGYPTKKHREAIAEYGVTPYHRITFTLLGNNDNEPSLF